MNIAKNRNGQRNVTVSNVKNINNGLDAEKRLDGQT
jgi:hypothetical protein